MTRESGITAVVARAKDVFPEDYAFPVIYDMLKFEELYPHDGQPVPHAVPCLSWKLDDPQLIMHSSGMCGRRVESCIRADPRLQDLLPSRTLWCGRFGDT